MNPVVIRDLKIGEGMPKICVPIVGIKKCDILEAARELRDVSADIVEWRADWFESVFEIESIESILIELRKLLGDMPILFTFRTKKEGGEREISYEKYAELLIKVASTKQVDLIDVEAFVSEHVAELIDEIKNHGVKVVGSNHDFEKTPNREEIVRRLCDMQTMGADLLKIAVMPHNEADVLTLLQATHEMFCKHARQPIITMSMSEQGVVSRVAGEMFGSSVTFGTVQKASAPGQLPVEELKQILEILHRDE